MVGIDPNTPLAMNMQRLESRIEQRGFDSIKPDKLKEISANVAKNTLEIAKAAEEIAQTYESLVNSSYLSNVISTSQIGNSLKNRMQMYETALRPQSSIGKNFDYKA